MSSIKPQTLKGFRDFLPEDAIKRNWLKDKIRGIFESWGYDPLETPTLEHLELFAGQIGEDEKLFFKFEDTGGRKVALRYDQTVPACRVVGQYRNKISLPFKRYQIQPAFRAEKPQAGRYREFLQCDADIWGIASPLADAESITLSLDICRKLGFKQAVAYINDRKLLKDIPYNIIASIDKLKKIGRDRVLLELKKKGVTAEKGREYLETVVNLKPNETISIILEYLKKSGFSPDWYRFEPSLVRSFAYSDGPVWEIEIPGFTAGSVLGGERFDKLTYKLTGFEVPAVGFGLGFDRTLEALEQFNLIPSAKTVSKILVTVFNESLFDGSLALTEKLRGAGFNAEIYPDPGAKLDKQLKYADNKGVPFAVILGPEEVEKGAVTVKNLKNREQKTLSLIDIIDYVLSKS